MSEIPDVFTGGWVRRGISLDGGPFREDAVVWWLQTPSIHADLRVPRDADVGPTCFAGVTSWDGSALTWTRRLDLEQYDGVDTGTATWDGEDLLEAGELDNGDGTRTTYVERWVRLRDSADPIWAEERDGLIAVRAGAYGLTVVDARAAGGGFQGTAWLWTDGHWAVHHTVPGAPPAPSPSDLRALR